MCVDAACPGDDVAFRPAKMGVGVHVAAREGSAGGAGSGGRTIGWLLRDPPHTGVKKWLLVEKSPTGAFGKAASRLYRLAANRISFSELDPPVGGSITSKPDPSPKTLGKAMPAP